MKQVKLGRTELIIQHNKESFYLEGRLSSKEFTACVTQIKRLTVDRKLKDISYSEQLEIMHLVTENSIDNINCLITFTDDKANKLCSTHMKITGTRSYADIESCGRTARFDGELCAYAFYADAESMRWLPPYECDAVTPEKRIDFIKRVNDFCRISKIRFKLVFTDASGNKIKL